MRFFTKFTSLLLLVSILMIMNNCQRQDPSAEFKPLIDKYVGYWNTGNFEGIEDVLDPDFELRMTPKFEPELGIDTFKTSILKLREAYPDFKIVINEIIYDVDKAAALWTITATNTGPGRHPPTGKKIVVTGISIVHFKDGKIKDEWIAGNNGYWLTQLGFKLVPPENIKE